MTEFEISLIESLINLLAGSVIALFAVIIIVPIIKSLVKGLGTSFISWNLKRKFKKMGDNPYVKERLAAMDEIHRAMNKKG